MYHDHPTHIATPARRVLVPRTGPGLDRHPVSGLRGSIPHELFLFCYLPHQYHLKSPQVRYLGKVVSQSPNLSCVPASTTVNINTTKQKEKKKKQGEEDKKEATMASDEQTSTTPITVVLPTVTPSTNISNAADTAPSSRSSSRASTSQRLHSLDNTTTHVSPTHSLNVSYPATEASHKKQTYPPFQDHFSASSTRRSKPEDQSSLGRPGSKMALSPTLRNHGTAALAELVGTFLFLFFAFSAAGVANAVPPEFSDGIAVPNIAALLYISFAFGISLMVNVFAFYRISGGQFNPAVSQ